MSKKLPAGIHLQSLGTQGQIHRFELYSHNWTGFPDMAIIPDYLKEGKLRNIVYTIGREHRPSKDIWEAELESESEAYM